MTENKSGAPDMVEVKVNALAFDDTTKSPVVILGPADSDDILPIWIGHYEAWAIAMEMSGVPSKRPMTHDLLKSVIESLNAKVIKIEIFDLRDQTFYARIVLRSDRGDAEVDARPSDSIALALKWNAPILADRKLLSLRPAAGSGQKKLDPQELKERLKRINPEDFGKYSL